MPLLACCTLTGAAGVEKTRFQRPRQHVNPLASHFQKPLELPAGWQPFRQALPLHLDIGCAAGHFCMAYAKRHEGQRNVLGLEIRETLVDRANGWVREGAAGNVHFLQCNANTANLDTLLDACPSPLHSVSVQFPDPWFKKRHHKRRVFNADLAACLARHLTHTADRATGEGGEGACDAGWIFVQSDVQEVAEDMRAALDTVPSLEPALGCDGGQWLERNPLGVATERELASLRLERPVWRALYQIQRR